MKLAVIPFLMLAMLAPAQQPKPAAPRFEPPLAEDVLRMDRIVGKPLHYDRQSIGKAAHGRDCRGVSGPAGGGVFDLATGILVSLDRDDLVNEQPQHDVPIISLADARDRANGFLQRAGIVLDRSWIESSVTPPRAAGGGAYRSYDFAWRRYYHGLRLPALLLMNIDAVTGDVQWLALYDDPVTVSIQPTLSAEQASALVATRTGYDRWKLRAPPQLEVHYYPRYPGPQILRWSLQIDNLDGRGNVGRDGLRYTGQHYVNAHTGTVSSIAYQSIPAGKGSPPLSNNETEGVKARPKPPRLDLKKLAAEPLPPTLFKEKGQKDAGKSAPPAAGKPARKPD